ncbi:MAG: hypothetical protein OES26_25280 [Gammaproteobacteria bacterium]|nr:hypothetical protein [Gammaproteobacteria bacterium]
MRFYSGAQWTPLWLFDYTGRGGLAAGAVLTTPTADPDRNVSYSFPANRQHPTVAGDVSMLEDAT